MTASPEDPAQEHQDLNLSQESSAESNNHLQHQTSTNISGYAEVMRVPKIKVKVNHNNQMMPPPLPAVIKRVINRRKLPQVQVNHKPIFKLESIKKEVNRVQMDIISSANNTQREADIEKKVLRLT